LTGEEFFRILGLRPVGGGGAYRNGGMGASAPIFEFHSLHRSLSKYS
jgi:hypothetical protein